MPKPKAQEPEIKTVLAPDTVPDAPPEQIPEAETQQDEMAKDTKLRLIPPPTPTNSFVTITGTYTGPTIQWNGQYAPWNTLSAEFDYKNASATSGNPTVVVTLQDSPDGTTWNNLATSTTVTLSTTVGGGVLAIPVTSTKKYIRCQVAVGANGTVDMSGAVATGVFGNIG